MHSEKLAASACCQEGKCSVHVTSKLTISHTLSVVDAEHAFRVHPGCYSASHPLQRNHVQAPASLKESAYSDP